MNAASRLKVLGICVVAGAASGCAGMEELVSAPEVSLANVEVTTLDLQGQTFRLGFDVSNPNPFPLPVTRVSYGVELDGNRFATGETEGSFTVPANGEGEFAIHVQLNLLQSAPKLLYTLHDGVTGEIPYALKGSMGINIPFAKAVKFESSGQIRLHARAAQR